ncbi:uncharacterized protein LOC141595213 [Silene latifolia]|uniref:uncharacterized protein LOC141595213 n=1 Tax=Silene latifolia TaxID=37657 RepID=UPI003D77C7D3
MECVRSTSFSIALNGETFGFFQGKRGLRQGDPMSPLLFTLCMEYLSRILLCATRKLPFSYHPLCHRMKLTHLIFADDLLLFCKGDIKSIMVILRSYSAFSVASGLNMNAQKSCAYFNGVNEELKRDILFVSGFMEGKLPFKYLGVPITAGRLKKKECVVLIDKIVDRIKSLGARRLSYAGRLVLVNSMLASLYNYWASMFRNLTSFGCNGFTTFTVRIKLSISINLLPMLAGIGGRYVRNQVSWSNAVWNSMAIPKHSFIAWIIANKALMLKQKLFKLHISSDDLCCICLSQTETHMHLFTECVYSQQILQLIGNWLIADFSSPSILNSIPSKRWSKLRKQVCTITILAAWYQIWSQRNKARINGQVQRAVYVFNFIKASISQRFHSCKPQVISDKDTCWLSRVQLV